MYGLYNLADLESVAQEVSGDDKALAMTGGDYSSPIGRTFLTPDPGGTLRIKHISVNPKNLGQDQVHSFGISALRQTLDALTTSLAVTLVIDETVPDVEEHYTPLPNGTTVVVIDPIDPDDGQSLKDALS